MGRCLLTPWRTWEKVQGQGKGLLRGQGCPERGNHAETPRRTNPSKGWGAGRSSMAPCGRGRLEKLPSPLVLPSPSAGSATHNVFFPPQGNFSSTSCRKAAVQFSQGVLSGLLSSICPPHAGKIRPKITWHEQIFPLGCCPPWIPQAPSAQSHVLHTNKPHLYNLEKAVSFSCDPSPS